MTGTSKKETTKLPPGTWGGRHVRLEVREAGADIEYDCAHGTIDAALLVDGAGRFEARGTHTAERPGPVRLGHTPDSRPALYSGRVRGDVLTLSATLTDTSEKLDTFTLTRGSQGHLVKCR